jgi:hypothetical protein
MNDGFRCEPMLERLIGLHGRDAFSDLAAKCKTNTQRQQQSPHAKRLLQ